MGHDSEFDQKRFSSIPISRQLLKQELELDKYHDSNDSMC